MAENQFLTYQKFNDQSEAKELSDLLVKNNIEYLYEDTSASFDPSFANNPLDKEYRIKLKPEDFEKVDHIIMDLSEQPIDSVEADYYLFEFTNNELKEILSKRDEWSKFDYLLAQKILKDRGQEVSKELLSNMQDQRFTELAKPEEHQTPYIIAGYVFAVLGGLLGIFIGWHLFSHQKTLPNGERVYVYSITDRAHGKRILILGILFLLLWASIKLLAKV